MARIVTFSPFAAVTRRRVTPFGFLLARLPLSDRWMVMSVIVTSISASATPLASSANHRQQLFGQRLLARDQHVGDQIGRASGRERVGQYGQSLEVAGTLQKKTRYQIKV